MKARTTTAAMDRPTRAPILGREDHRGAECLEGTWETACYSRSTVGVIESVEFDSCSVSTCLEQASWA